MKTTVLIFLTLISSISLLQAQEEVPDTTRVKIGELEIEILERDSEDVEVRINGSKIKTDDFDFLEKAHRTHWAGIDMGVITVMDDQFNTDLAPENEWLELDPIRSLAWHFNVVEAKIPLVENKLGIFSGVGLNYNSYGIQENYRVLSTPDSVFAIQDTIFPSARKNKLRSTYLRVPLMFEVNTSNIQKRNFHIAMGVVGGMRIGSLTNRKYEDNGKNVREKRWGNYHFQRWTADASVRVGYSYFTVWALYGLTPIFEQSKKSGQDVHNLTVGVTLVPW